MRRARVPADLFVSWDDVLHDGPVQRFRTLAEARASRAQHLAGQGYGNYDEILAALEARDDSLNEALRSFDEIVLWFEHDLYDQLQLVQILARVEIAASGADVRLVCHDRFIAESPHDVLWRDFESRVSVEQRHLSLARRAWEALTAGSPNRLGKVGREESHALRYLQDAIRRLLQELPDPYTGLSRSQRQILRGLIESPMRPGPLFRYTEDLEEAKYMGDWTFWSVLRQMALGKEPLVTLSGNWPSIGWIAVDTAFFETEVSVTDAGRDVFHGKRNALDVVGIDRWLGGTHLRPQRYWAYADAVLTGPHSRQPS